MMKCDFMYCGQCGGIDVVFHMSQYNKVCGHLMGRKEFFFFFFSSSHFSNLGLDLKALKSGMAMVDFFVGLFKKKDDL